MNFDRFYLYSEAEEYLNGIAKEFPDFVKLESLYKTDEGRNIYLVKLLNFKKCKEEDMPAYYVQGGVHARECGATTATLNFINELIYKRKELLDNCLYYIVPMCNPDNMERVMTTNMPIRSKLKEKFFNGITPKDMDGNGLILNMRIKNPHGNMKEDPDSPGVMIPRQPGDVGGEYYDVTFEGEFENDCYKLDNTSYLSIDFNRSYPSGWSGKANSGDYPFQEDEERAFISFIASHKNIFAAIDVHCGQNAIIRTNIHNDEDFPPEDLKLMKKISEIASDIIGFPSLRCDDYAGHGAWSVAGNFNAYAYDVLGINSYVIELGNGFNDAGFDTLTYIDIEDKSNLLKYVRECNPDVFVPWKKFNHPQLGEVELGGFIDGRAYYMKPETMKKVCPKVAEFLCQHSMMGPKLDVDNITVDKLSDKIYRIRYDIMNIGKMNTTVMSGARGTLSKWSIMSKISGDINFKILNKRTVNTKSGFAPLERLEQEWFVETDDISKLYIDVSHPKSINVKKYLK